MARRHPTDEPLDAGNNHHVDRKLLELYEVLEYQRLKKSRSKADRRLRDAHQPDLVPLTAGAVPIISRAQWGARPPKSVSHNITPETGGCALHYEGPKMGAFPHTSCATKVRGIQAFHMDQRGWADIAYNAMVCPHGYMFEARGGNVRSAAQGTNDGNQRYYAICGLWGAGDAFTDEAKRAYQFTIDLLRFVARAGKDVQPHRHFHSTACLPLDVTEVLTPTGWRLLRDVDMDTDVASYSNDSATITFNRPLAITTPYFADTITVRSLEMTPDHRLYVRKQGEAIYKVREAKELRDGWQWYIPVSGHLADPAGLEAGLDLIRFLVWVQADGYYQTKGGRLDHLHFHFRKERKVQRVTTLLNALDKEFKLSRRRDGSTVIKVYGTRWITENVLRFLPEKQFTWEWLHLTENQFLALDDELLDADGCRANGKYSSAIQQNLDVILALYHLHGRQARLTKDGAGVSLSMARSGNDYMTVLKTRGHHRPGRKNVLVGCLATVNDTILIRQRGEVAVVGNCPGDPVANWITAGLPAPGGTAPTPPPAPPAQETRKMVVVEQGDPEEALMGAGYAGLFAAAGVVIIPKGQTTGPDPIHLGPGSFGLGTSIGGSFKQYAGADRADTVVKAMRGERPELFP